MTITTPATSHTKEFEQETPAENSIASKQDSEGLSSFSEGYFEISGEAN